MKNIFNSAAGLAVVGVSVAISPSASAQFGYHITDPVPAQANAATDTGEDYGNQIAPIARGRWLSMCRSNEPVNGQFGDDFDILATQSADGGASWTMPYAINTDAMTDQGRDRGPQYASDGRGNWIIIWYRGDIEQSGSPDQDVFFATSNDNAQTWSDPIDLAGDSFTDGAEDDHPQVATDGNSRWIIVWASKRTLDGRIGSDYDILISRADSIDGPWTSPAALNSNAPTDAGGDRIVQVNTNGTGTWIVTWHSNDSLGGHIGTDDDILYVRSDDNGDTWSDPYPLNNNAATDSGSDTFVQIANDGAGHWVAVWGSTENLRGRIGNDQDILFATSDDDGVTWSDPYPLNNNAAVDQGDDETPQLRTDNVGNWVCCWSSTDTLNGTIGHDMDILIARSIDNGRTWTDPIPASSFASGDGGGDHYSHLAHDDVGNWLIQWRSNTDGGIYGDDWDIFVCRFFIPVSDRPLLYVDQNAEPGGDGSSWDRAFNDLQQALDLAANSSAVQEIWVAAGRYQPDWATGNRRDTFRLVNGVGVYGGFAGTEQSRDQRDPVLNPTILTGDIGAIGDNTDNSYHVVTATNVGPQTVLDGFTVQLGWADGLTPNDRGAGLLNEFGSPTINNCRFIDHFAYGVDEQGVASGDGAGFFNQQGSPLVTNCYFSGNVARRRGGAVFSGGGRATFRQCEFVDNRIFGGILGSAGGGAVFNFHGAPTYASCYFEHNSAGDGGCFYNHFADTTMLYCDFVRNDGRYGASLYNYSAEPIIAFCTFRENDSHGRFLTRDAGAVFNRESRPLMINCLMADNYAWRGGAMYNIHSAPELINCTIINNYASDNGATMHNLRSGAKLRNCVLWNPDAPVPEIADLFNSRTRMTYCDVRGGWPGDGNLQVDPQTVFANGHYPPGPGSPLIDAGNNDVLPPGVDIDLLGNPRRIDDPDVPDTGHGSAPVVDIGAYEHVP